MHHFTCLLPQATNYCYTPNAFLLRGSGATEDA